MSAFLGLLVGHVPHGNYRTVMPTTRADRLDPLLRVTWLRLAVIGWDDSVIKTSRPSLNWPRILRISSDLSRLLSEAVALSIYLTIGYLTKTSALINLFCLFVSFFSAETSRFLCVIDDSIGMKSVELKDSTMGSKRIDDWRVSYTSYRSLVHPFKKMEFWT